MKISPCQSFSPNDKFIYQETLKRTTTLDYEVPQLVMMATPRKLTVIKPDSHIINKTHN
ncbi:hypothetical protein H6G56_03225 [Anabaena variabilis FACHB-164]|uniref:hypothetical protein n=1 Tax=Anabaena variabilis TaxID=264691 RepID=UPI0016824A6C|nr:hypothetical protein [Trichormus variabilis]MBD2625480.1 hypothetical protein [Trichormus variabilis FACHB-164]